MARFDVHRKAPKRQQLKVKRTRHLRPRSVVVDPLRTSRLSQWLPRRHRVGLVLRHAGYAHAVDVALALLQENRIVALSTA